MAKYPHSYIDPLPVRLAINAIVSRKTTLGGILTAIGGALLGAKAAVGVDVPGWALVLGLILSAVGPVILGTQARDGDASSQDHDIRA